LEHNANSFQKILNRKMQRIVSIIPHPLSDIFWQSSQTFSTLITECNNYFSYNSTVYGLPKSIKELNLCKIKGSSNCSRNHECMNLVVNLKHFNFQNLLISEDVPSLLAHYLILKSSEKNPKGRKQLHMWCIHNILLMPLVNFFCYLQTVIILE